MSDAYSKKDQVSVCLHIMIELQSGVVLVLGHSNKNVETWQK